MHAAAQVCSFKGEMIYHHTIGGDDDGGGGVKKQLDAMRKKVNGYLPSDVQVLDFERVTRMFCARTNRDKVRYQYMVPSYVLCSKEEVERVFTTALGDVGEGKDKMMTTGDDDDKSTKKAKLGYNTNNITPMEASTIVQETISDEVLARARHALMKYRVTPKQMEQLRSGLKLFEGTHSFHNYTRRVGADNASATRYILSFVPLDPIIVPSGDDDNGDSNSSGKQLPDMS